MEDKRVNSITFDVLVNGKIVNIRHLIQVGPRLRSFILCIVW